MHDKNLMKFPNGRTPIRTSCIVRLGCGSTETASIDAGLCKESDTHGMDSCVVVVRIRNMNWCFCLPETDVGAIMAENVARMLNTMGWVHEEQLFGMGFVRNGFERVRGN